MSVKCKAKDNTAETAQHRAEQSRAQSKLGLPTWNVNKEIWFSKCCVVAHNVDVEDYENDYDDDDLNTFKCLCFK